LAVELKGIKERFAMRPGHALAAKDIGFHRITRAIVSPTA